MKKTTSSLGESLVFEGLLTPQQYKKIQSETNRTREPFHKALRRFAYVEEDKLLPFLSAKFDIPEIQISHQNIKPEVLKLIPETLVRKFSVLPLKKIGRRLTVAVNDPLNLNTLDQLRLASGFEVEPRLATESEIQRAIEQYYGMKSDMSDVTEALQTESDTAEKVVLREPDLQTEEAPIIKLVNQMIGQAAKEGASDIHVEPARKDVLVRYRVDGVLREVDRYPKKAHTAVVSRIKVMSNLDISESRIPQDGRVQVESSGQSLDLRISIMPTVHGENLVIRLLNLKSAILSLELLGMGKKDLETFQKLITKPYGILLLTGPTGSGKTTTLYAALNQINSFDKNIVTIEDPVEYQLPLIRQIQVNPRVDLNFANGLRSILRQDPDIVMVGEIRDRETAEIAIQAALTGHLVFSTLHTNDASSTISRLIDMGIEPFLISSTIVGIIAQRLVRQICGDCRQEIPVDPESTARAEQVARGSSIKLEKLFRGRGCLSCKKTGYRGRKGLFEFLVPNDEIRNLIIQKASSNEIAAKAIQNGMRTLRQDGLEKIGHGETTVDEIMRATQEV